MTIAVDPATGLAIPQARVGVRRARPKGIGSITYRCHTCGESIVKPYEVLFVDDSPARPWASSIEPARVTPRTTTHHDWHMASRQHEDD